MSTLRLDQLDSYQTSFESRVVEVEAEAIGRAWLRLEASLFYPTSGGQPHDTGRLNGALVRDVQKRGGEVWQFVEGELPEVGETVRGTLDWRRRYRHMQRHSAQHLLSQAFLRVNPRFETRSVSLKGPICTIDFAGEPTEDDLSAAERLVGEAVYANYEIRAFEVDEADIHKYRLRRPPKVTGKIRLVQMGDWELSACGGTHLRSTAEAGPVKLLRSERIRGGLTRLHFCSGWEALEDYALKHAVGHGLARDFSAQVAEVPARVAALQDELSAAKGHLSDLQAQLATLLGTSLLARAETGPHGRLVSHELSETDSAMMGPLAQMLAAEEDVTALLGTTGGDKALLLFARGSKVPADMAELLREVLPLVEGRGGGKAELAQGGGSRPAGLAEALEQARQKLLQQVSSGQKRCGR